MCCNSKGCCHGKCGCLTSKVGYWLVIIGAVNWGLVGLGSFLGMNLNLVYLIFGFSMVLENLVYVLVGVSGVMLVVGCPCNKCKSGVCESCAPGEKCACGGSCVNGKCDKCGNSCGDTKSSVKEVPAGAPTNQ